MKRALILVLSMLCLAGNTQTAWETMNLKSLPPAETAVLGTSSGHGIHFYTSGQERFELTGTGALKFHNLGNTQSRILQVDATGVMSTAPLHFTDGYLNLCQDMKLSINATSPLATLDVGGSGRLASNLGVGGRLYLGGSSSNFGVISYSQGSSTTPSVFRIMAGGSFNGQSGQEYNGPGSNQQQDPTDLMCAGLTTQIPSMVYMQNRLVIAHNTNALSLGAIDIGHDGTNGIIETRGIGPNPKTNPASDLVINGTCGRNVYVFGGTNFENTSSDVMSIKGKLNIASNVQLGAYNASSFSDPSVRLLVDGGTSNGIKIRHTGTPTQYALRAVASNNSNLLTVFGDGLLEIAASGPGALIIKDKNQNNTDRFSVSKDGSVYAAGSIGLGTIPSAGVFVNINAGINSQSADLIKIGSISRPNALKITGQGSAIFDCSGNSGTLFQIKTSKSDALNISANGVSTFEAAVSNSAAFKIRNNGSDVFEVAHNGVSYAREIVVTTFPFPDYVFSDEYDLRKLDEVRAYVQTHKHLPNMPTAQKIESEGAALGELQRLTVEKVEELYLYVFQLEEKISTLTQRINQLNERHD